MTLLDLLDARRSTPARLLGDPGPGEADLDAMLRAAVRVPDHGALEPWRFLRVRGAARAALGAMLARRMAELDPDTAPAAIKKQRGRFLHAPLVLIVVARLQREGRIPEHEQLLSGACVCFALLQAAQAVGFGAQWLTGWAAYDRDVAERLGLSQDEQVLGFVHVGTADGPVPERRRPDPRTLLSDWEPER